MEIITKSKQLRQATNTRHKNYFYCKLAVLFLKGSFSVMGASASVCVGVVVGVEGSNDVVEVDARPGCRPSASTHLYALVEKGKQQDAERREKQNSKPLK